MSFQYERTIRFADTDAAGVVYFANILSICHEAYEASLAECGIDLKSFFSDRAIAIPIVSAHVDFFRPIFCGDRISVGAIAQSLTLDSFQLTYALHPRGSQSPCLAKATTKHVCIDLASRSRQPLSPPMAHWLKLMTS
jgi:1,4-dihydroxy-2-naphthoyl-CoA hydrolase